MDNILLSIASPKRTYWLFCLLVTFVLVITACDQTSSNNEKIYVTNYGLGPDKWASVWLVENFINPGVTVRVVAADEELDGDIPFDTENSEFRRTVDKTTFTHLLEFADVSDPVVLQLAQIVHDIEVNFWTGAKHDKSEVVEEGFRLLQLRYNRTEVPAACYSAFFSNVYSMLADKKYRDPEYLLPYRKCEEQSFSKESSQHVEEMPLHELLKAVSQRKKVIFVDAREIAEFEENHIPLARNLQIRDVSPDTVSSFKDADIVVAYCVKDFRGYELAKSLQAEGIDQAVILNPYGIAGWKASGLPIYVKGKISEADASSQLQQCADFPSACLKGNNDG